MGDEVPERLGPGQISATASFPHLPLAPGRYTISATCIESRGITRRGEVYFKVEQAASLVISETFTGYTPIQLLADWRIK